MAQDNKKPLYTLYESLRSDNYDVPDTYESFERTLTAPGEEGTANRMTLYNSLRSDNYDVPDTYESFANTLFSPASAQQQVSPVVASAAGQPAMREAGMVGENNSDLPESHDGFGGGRDAFEGSEAQKRMEHYREVVRERNREEDARRKEEMAFLKDATDFYTRMSDDSKAERETRLKSRDEYARMMRERELANAEGRRNADYERSQGIEWEDPAYRRELDAIEPEYSSSGNGAGMDDGDVSAMGHRRMMSEEEARRLSAEAYDGKPILAYDKDRKGVDPVTGKGGYVDRTRYPARARVMKEPEDIWSVRGKVDRTFTSEEPGGLPELSVTGISKGALKRRYDEYLRLHPELGDVAEGSDRSRELMGSLRSEMIDEGRAADEAFETWMAENPHKVRNMSEEELAGKREEIRADREFARRMGNLDLERDYIFRRYGERTAELTAALRDEFESKGLRPEGNRWLYALDAALRGDEELKALNVQSYNLGKAAERYEDWIADGRQGSIVNFAQGAGGALKEALMNPFGLSETQGSMLPLMHIKRKLADDRGKGQDAKAGEGAGSSLSRDEVLALESYFLNQETQGRTKMSLARSSGEFTGALAEMAAEFGLNPASGLARRTLARIVAEVGKDGAMSLIRKSSRLARMVGYKGVEVSGARVAANLGKVTAAALGEGAVMSATTQGLKNLNAAAGRTIAEPVYDDSGNLAGVEGENAGSVALKTGVSSALTNAAFVFPATFGAKVMRGFDNMARTMHVPFGNPVDALVKMKSGEAMSILTADAVGRSDIDPTWSDFADPEKNGELIMGLLAAELTSGAMRGTVNVANGARLRHGREMAKAEMMAKAVKGADAFSVATGSGNRQGDWVAIVKAVYEGDESTIVDALTRVARDGSMTAGQKEAVLDYARSAYRYIGADRAYEEWRTRGEREAAAREAEEDWNVVSEDTREMWEDEAYTRGYEAGQSAFAKYEREEGTGNKEEERLLRARHDGESGEKISKEATGETSGLRARQSDDIIREMRDARDRIKDAFPGSEAEYYMAELEKDPWGVLENPELTADQQEAVLDFINAKNAMKGMMDASGDVLDMKRRETERSIEMRTHKDKEVIIPATMKVDDRPVYIVTGDVVMFPDGSAVDARNSSKSVIVMDAQTGRYEFKSPDQISKVSEAVNPEEELAAAMSAIEEEHNNLLNPDNVASAEDAMEEIPEKQSAGQVELPVAERNAPLSKTEKDEQGIPLVVSSDGSTTFGVIGAETGLTEAPIRLSLGENRIGEDGKNHGYGLLHIEAGHGEQIRKAGFASVEAFVESVARNYTVIREGNRYGDQASYLLEVQDGHNNTLFIQLSRNGDYWNVNSAGIFRERYSRNKPVVSSLPTIGNRSSAEAIEVDHGQNKGAAVTSGNSSKTPVDKVNALPSDKQGDGSESLALSRIPVNEQGEPMFEAVDKETAWDGLVEAVGTDTDAADIAMAQVHQANIDLEALRKKPPTMKAPKLKGSPMAMARAKREAAEKYQSDLVQYNRQIAEAQSRLDAWNGIAGVYESRNAKRRQDGEAGEEERLLRARHDGEAETIHDGESERIWKETMSRMDKRIREAADEMRDCPEAVALLQDLDPHNIYEVAAHVLSYNRILLNDDGSRRGYYGMTGYGREEARGMFGLFATAEKGGKSIEALAENVMKEDCDIFGVAYDNGDAVDALLDVLQSCRTRGEINNYIVNNRIDQARRVYDSYKSHMDIPPEDEALYMRYQQDRECMDKYGMTRSEYDECIEAVYELAKKHLENFDENEYYGNIADEYASRELAIEKKETEIKRSGDDRERTESEVSDSERTGRGIAEIEDGGSEGEGNVYVGGDEFLPSGEADNRSGGEADEGGSGFQPEDGVRGSVPEISVSPEAQGSERVGSDKRGGETSLRSDHDISDHDVYRNNSLKLAVEPASSEVNVEPTEAQKAAGNYKMEHRRVDGYNISIENAIGSVRRGTGADGKPWETVMQNDYGYIRGTEGVDGDHIDVFLSDTPEDGDVFVVDQVNEDGSFDEHKVMYGFPSEQAARDAYLSNYEPGWMGLGAITHVSKDEFKKWIGSSRRKTKPFAEYKSVKPKRPIILSESQADELLSIMKEKAVVAPRIEVTDDNWRLSVETPIGVIKIGENQKAKLFEKGRGDQYGMLLDTLSEPNIILEERDQEENLQHERPSSYLFIKTFQKEDGSKYVHFESVTVSQDGMEVSISSHIIRENQLRNKMKSDRLLYKATALDESANSSAGQPINQGGSLSSDGKDNALLADKQAIEGESFESEYGEGVVNAFERYIAFKNAEGFEEKESEIEACEKLLDSLKERVEGMNGDELAAVERDIDSLVERESATDDGRAWLVSDFAHWVSRYAGLDKRRSEIERQRTLDNAVDAAQELTSAVPRKTKVRIDRFVDKRENSRLGGVYHDASRGMAVASDSRMLVMSVKDYNPENAGKVIAADGVKDVKYPDVARVIPSEDYCIARDAVDFGMLEGMAEDAMRQGKSEAVAVRSPQIAVRSVNNEYAIVDALVLRDFARGARHVGATEVGMYRSGETSWLVANGKDGLSLMIGKLYEPEKTLYRVNLGEGSGEEHKGVSGTLEMAEEVAAGYGAARESQDAWLRGESVARQMNLFDFDFSDEKPQDKGSGQSEKQNDKGIEPKEKPEDKGIEHKDKPDDKGFGQKEKPQEKGLERSESKRRMTIEDFGEKIAGARKDMLRDLSRNLGNVNVESLVKLPLGKAIKRPDFGRMVERGAMTEDEAMTAEAMWQEVYSSRKPSAASGRKRAIVEWAENTERKIRRLEEFINSDSDRRREIMEGLSGESFPDQERESWNFRNIQDMNPTRMFDLPLFTPSAAWVNRRVMEASGMRPGSGMKIEFSVRPNMTYQYYGLYDASGHRVMGFPSTRDLESAVDMVTLATRMHNGDLDVEYPSRFFNAKGRNAIQEPTGEFEVGWLKGHLYKNEICPDEETANKKAESLNARGVLARVYPVKRHAGYEDYAVRFRNPISGEEIVLEDSYPDRETVLQMIEDDPLSLSRKVNSILAERQTGKKAAKDHFYVTVVFEDHKLYHAVCRNNVGGRMLPWTNAVVKKFESRAAADTWLKENHGRLESEYAEVMKRKRSFVYFEQTDRPRTGEDYRNGGNVTPEQFSDTFGFRGVQFGNWTNDADRQAALNEAYDALRDLAGVLGLDNRALSLDGELGLAFGSRGSGSANAHYESGEVVINLTKTRGAGSLAHEWWHALDNYLMRKAGVANGFATEHLSGNSKIRSEIATAVRGLVQAVGNSDYGKRSAANGDYWGRVIEQTARLFGEWVVMKQEASGNRNYFLSRGIEPSIVDMYRAMTYADYKVSCRHSGEEPVSREEWNSRRESLGTFPYPTSGEVKELSAPMERVFEALRKGVDGGLAVTEIAMEPAIGYSQGSLFEKPRMRARQLSLFDDGFENMELPDEATVKVDAAVDEYSEALAEIFKYPEDAMPEDVLDRMWDKRDSLVDILNDYFKSLGNSEKDASDRAREMLVTLQAQVSVAALRKGTGEEERLLRARHDGEAETIHDGETSGAVAKESEVVMRETAGGDLLSYRHNGLLRELGEGEFSLMERRFSETGEFHFSGDSKIESADDVAYMLRNLEMKSVEHSFAVLTKEGVPTVVHLGMGNFNASPVNLAAVKAADNVLGGADRIWFVHNHPSGNLRNSPQDMNLHRTLQDMFGDRLEPSIILDTLRGQYAEFGETGNTNRLRPTRSRNGEEEVRVYQFDSAVYSKDYDFSKLSKIGASGDVASFLSGYRLGEGEKAGVLILNHMNQIVGNLPCTHSIDSPEGVDAIVNYAIHGGGTSVIVYGNDAMSREKLARLGEGIGARSGKSIRLLDVITRDGNDYTSANDAGIMEPEAEYGSMSVHEPMMTGRGRKEFDAMRERVVKEHGVVMPGLNEKEVRVVDVPRHDFPGSGKEALQKAEAWAKENIVDMHTAADSRGEEFEYSISNDAVEKYVSRSATGKSANIGIHLAALKKLPEIISESVEAEVHADYVKQNGERNANNEVNTESLVHRFFGAIKIDGSLYRVKTTMREYGDKNRTPLAHSYEVTQIELLKAPSDGVNNDSGEPLAMTSNSSMSVAKLLKGVEKSYDPGKKLLDESVKEDNSALRDSDIRYRLREGDAIISGTATKEKEDRVNELSDKLGVPIKIISDKDEIDNLPSVRHRRSKGWWSEDGGVVVVMPNNVNVADVDNTVVHEVVGHKGLRAFIGEERFDEFLGEIYNHASNPIRKVIDKMTDRMVSEESDRLRTRKAQARERAGEDVNTSYWTDMAEARVEAEKKREDFRREATEEYMADLGGRIGNEGFEKMSLEELTLWGKIKAKVQAFLDKFLQGLKIAKSIRLTDKDLAYILYRSWRNFRESKASGSRSQHGGIFAEAEDAVMRRRTGWDDAMLSESAKIEDANNRFNRQLQRYINGDMDKNEMLHLGKPQGIMRQFLPELPVVLRQRVIRKGSEKKHEVDVKSIMNMPQHLSSPIFVFQRSKNTIGVLTDMQDRNGKNVCVAIELKRQVQKGGEYLEINDVRSFHGREFKNIVEPIINNNTLKWVDKEKGLAYLSSASQPVQQEIDMQVLEDAAKIIKSFENPKFEGDEDVRFRDGADYVERDRVMARAMYEKRLQTNMYQFTEAMQDSMRGLMEFYRAVESQGAKRSIEDVASFENAYTDENRLSSRSHAEMEEYENRIMRPLLDIAARMAVDKKGCQDLTDYMMAKHGLERNAYMRNEALAKGEKTGRDFAGLCGLTGKKDWRDAENAAQQMVDDYEAAHSADIAEFWSAVNKATKTSLKKVYDCGLLSKEQYEKTRDMYDYYIPLRGFDEKTSDDVYGYLTSKGGAFSSPIKKAEGRKSKADDPLATIAYMAQNSIIQGNRNLMKQKFLTYVQNHPSDLASVNKLWLAYDAAADIWKPVFADIKEGMSPGEADKAVADFEERMESLSKSEPDKYKRGRDALNIPYRLVDGNVKEHQVIVKRNGESYVVTINGNPRAAQAVNGLTNPDNELNGGVGKVLNLASYINRQLSQVYTTRNPDFVVSNFIRDFLYSNTMVHVKEDPGYAFKFHWNYAKTNPIRMIRLLHLYEADKLDMHKPVHRMFYEFMHWGGETGYTMQRDLEQEKKLVKQLIKEARRGKLNPKSIWHLICNKLDQINRGVENSARFAAFITSRENGRDVQRSVYDAKEISVNFNKKGAGGKFMKAKGQTLVGKSAGLVSDIGRSLHVFWNAAIQGTTNFFRTSAKHPWRAIPAITSLVVLGYLLAALNDDDDEEDKDSYYNMPKYIRRSNLMFRAGEQWVTIPLPVEYRAIYGLGELAYGVTSGREEYTDIELAKEISAQLSQILPLDVMEGGGGLNALVPSAVKPLYESAKNVSWTGQPIYKETPFNEDLPEWTKAYPRTNAQLVDLSRMANEASGGNDYKAGVVNINPAQLEYILNGYFGGYSNIVNKLVKTGETMTGEREYDPSSILLVNRLVKMGDERTSEKKMNSDFFKYLDEYKRTHFLLRKYEDEAERGSDKYRVFLNALKHSRDGSRHDVMNDYISDYNWLNRAIKDPEISDDDRKTYEDNMRRLKREVVSLMKVAHDSVQVNRLKEEFAQEYEQQ